LRKWKLYRPIFLTFGISVLCFISYQMIPKRVIDVGKLPLNIVDIHAHTVCFSESWGCIVHEDLSSGIKGHIYESAFTLSKAEMLQKGDAYLVAEIARLVRESRYLRKATILALDGVYDNTGKLDKLKTQIYIPNDFVAKSVAGFPELLFGASINPKRKDWLLELDRADKNGAVLVKWIPSIQLFDPGDQSLIPFYQELVRRQIPLLTHTGNERAFITAEDSWADPRALELPLSIGVTVIAAHVGTTGHSGGRRNVDLVMEMLEKYPNLYADISSMTQLNKLAYWDQVFSNENLRGRLLYGSDFPLINSLLVSPLYSVLSLSLSEIKQLLLEDNPFDRDILYKVALGAPPEVFKLSGAFLTKFEEN